MFYLNSSDTSLIPDSLFFLHKIGLLKHRKTDWTSGIKSDGLYLIENNVPHKIYTLETLTEMRGTKNTVLIFDFMLGVSEELLKDQDVVVVPHVYYDYVTTLKELIDYKSLNSLRIFSPETNNTLVPKKHLKITVPVLEDADFIHFTNILPHNDAKTASNFSVFRFLTYVIKSVLSSLIVFCVKPVTQTKLFFAKYTPRFIFGKIRVFFIKSFYFIVNLRFEISSLWYKFKHLCFRIKQSRYIFYKYTPRYVWGKIWMGCVAGYFKTTHLIKMGSVRLYWGTRRFFNDFLILVRYQPKAILGKLRVSVIRGFYFLINLRFHVVKIFYFIVNRRFDVWHAINSCFTFFRYAPARLLGAFRVILIRSAFFIANLRFPLFHFFNKIFTFLRFTPVYYFGVTRVALIRLFYFVVNLRYPLWRYLSAFYWLNFRYTFYPARKIYWILEHEFQKRILKTQNVSKH